ncbi:hypothetical protein IC619_006975 [Hazenella sp. IB182353]|uniref:RAMP superfamily CRISPR-associated protein n=1 Tax=Polycladospora coralii TaxID=2771432 RepID=UPI00174790DC|nr:RAMP superfamily CRISPR-associated protein [Polycladospora coralii]MBS7530234.1 hypothetical protein [Polycladospora coralii]
MADLRVEFCILTKMNVRGFENNKEFAFRLSSFKGVLRYWARAIEPSLTEPDVESITGEDRLFGSARTGQAQFRMRLDEKTSGRKFYGSENHTFSIIFSMKASKKQEWETLVKSIWALGMFGGIGSKAGQGKGAVQIEKWEFLRKGNESEVEFGALTLLCDKLPIPENKKDSGKKEKLDSWLNQFEQAMKQHMPNGAYQYKHPQLSADFSPFIRKEGIVKSEYALKKARSCFAGFKKLSDDEKENYMMDKLYPEYRESEETSKDDFKRVISPIKFRVIQVGGLFYPIIIPMVVNEHLPSDLTADLKVKPHELNQFLDYIKEQSFEEVYK